MNCFYMDGGIFIILSLILRKSLTGIVVLVRKSASWSLVCTYSYVSNFALVQFSNEVVVCGNVFAAKLCYVVAFDSIDC